MSSSECVMYVANAGVLGNLQVGVEYDAAQVAAAGVLRDSVLLHSLEPLTQSFEALISAPLNWQLSPEYKRSETLPALELKVVFAKTSTIFSATVKLSSRCLPMLFDWVVPESSEVIKASWTPVQAEVCLSVLQLSNTEKADLEHGALVMIPESFESTWNATVCNEELVIEGVYNPQQDTWSVRDNLNTASAQYALASDSEDHAAEKSNVLNLANADAKSAECFRLCVECQVDPLELLKADASIANLLSGTNNDVSRYSGLYLKSGAGECYKAHLLVLGAGQAVLLEQIELTAA